MNLGLRGKVAVVTGDSDGLGLATSRRLAVEGRPSRSVGATGRALRKPLSSSEGTSGWPGSARSHSVALARPRSSAPWSRFVSAQAAFITGVATNFDGGHSAVV
jgi:hypothetical protein